MIINNTPEYFLTVAKYGSISKAASILYVSQSYLSQHILKLERSFDVKLFDRSKSPLELTETGKLYYSYLQANNMLYTKLTADFDALNNERINTLNLGIPPWRGSIMLPRILPVYLEKNQNVQVNLHECPTRQLYDLIEKNVIDIAIVNMPLNESLAIDTELIKYEKIFLIVHKQNQCVKILREIEAKNEIINIDILRDECFILLKEGMACSERVHKYLKKIHFTPAKSIFTSSRQTAYNLVEQNIGISFMPESGVLWSPGMKDLEFFDLRQEDLVAPLAVVYKKNIYLSSAARKFIDVVKKLYVDL